MYRTLLLSQHDTTSESIGCMVYMDLYWEHDSSDCLNGRQDGDMRLFMLFSTFNLMVRRSIGAPLPTTPTRIRME